MKMKNISLVFIVLLFLSCEKANEKDIVYQVSDNSTGYALNFRNAEGKLIKTQIVPESSEDVWKYSFQAEQGDIVFLSALYQNPADGINVQIFIDGKAFKQGSSQNDTLRYVTVSGTIPFE